MISSPDATAEVLPVCELHGGDEVQPVATLSVSPRRKLRVCILCLALAIQNETGWALVRVVQQYMVAKIQGAEQAARWRIALAVARGEVPADGAEV